MNQRLNLLSENRLFKILQSHEDQEFFVGAIMFSRLAEFTWAREIHELTVKHGYSHIFQIIDTVEFLLQDLSDEEIIKTLTIEYVFVLLVSIYCHDVGMQDYYDVLFPHLKKKKDLSKFDLSKIRDRHQDIIARALTELNSDDDVKQFFGSEIVAQVRQIVGDNRFELFDKAVAVILDKKRKIGLVSSYHNKPIEELPVTIERNVYLGKLDLQESEKSALLLSAAILQFSDALDMSRNRVNEKQFKYQMQFINDGGTPTHDELRSIQKMTMCYLIDSIRAKRSGQSLEFTFEISATENDIAENKNFISECKRKYFRRIQRGENDCVTIIEKHLGLNIRIRLNQIKPTINSDKQRISEKFIRLMEVPKQRTLDQLLKHKLNQISEGAAFSYIKLYSPITQAYFGGISKGLETEPEYKKSIENAFFYRLDWKIPIEEGFVVTQNQSIKDLQVNPGLSRGYLKYIRLCKKRNIKTEIYYGIRDGDDFIGYINIHYDRLLTKKSLNQKKKLLDKELSTLALEIKSIHFRLGVIEFKQNMEGIEQIDPELRNVMSELFVHRFSTSFSHSNLIDRIDISQIKSGLSVSSISHGDSLYFVNMNRGLFTTFVKELILNEQLNKLADTSCSIKVNSYANSCNIELCVDDVHGYFGEHLIHAYTYLGKMDVRFDENDIVLQRILLPLKSFVAVFGGKIIPVLEKSNSVLRINLLFPQRRLQLS